MKQLWFGIGLLVFLLLGGIFLGNVLEEALLPAAKDLEKASVCALEGNWELAAALAARAERNWQARRKLTAGLAHHDPLDRIDTLFAGLRIYRNRKNAAAYGAACAELSQQLQALPQVHSFSLWNLL